MQKYIKMVKFYVSRETFYKLTFYGFWGIIQNKKNTFFKSGLIAYFNTLQITVHLPTYGTNKHLLN